MNQTEIDKLREKLNNNVFSHRYYNDPPESKSLEDCANHGYAHKGYNWDAQIDPRWTDEQKDAYIKAYYSE